MAAAHAKTTVQLTTDQGLPFRAAQGTILLYSWCTEDFGTADLQDARALLYALA